MSPPRFPRRWQAVRYRAPMRTMRVAGRIAVEDHGGDGPAVLLLHGLSSNLRIWDPVIPHLAGMRVVTMDARHHGRSSDAGADFSMPALADDVAAVVGELGLAEPVVVGHSWGASIALTYAGRDPRCPGVVCVDGGVIDMQAMGVTWEAAQEFLRPPVLEGPEGELLDRLRREQEHLPWDHLEPVVRRSFVTGPDGVLRRRLPIPQHMEIARTLWALRLDEVYARVSCPVLAVLAEPLSDPDPVEDGFLAARKLGVDRLSREHRLRVVWLRSVHDIPLLHPRELGAEVVSFVRERVGS